MLGTRIRKFAVKATRGPFLSLSTAEQIVSQCQTADNKNQSGQCFRNKQKKRHSDPETKKHQSKDPLHENLR